MSVRSANRREQIADAGIRIIARGGVRALTHRAVDHEAQLPQGSTSYHAATRTALIELIVEALATRSQSETDELAAIVTAQIQQRSRMDIDDVARLIAGMIETLAIRRDEMRVRYALLLEVGDAPRLQAQLTTASKVHASTQEVAASLLAAASLPASSLIVDELIVLTDGLVFHQTVLGSSPAAEPIVAAYLRGIAASHAHPLNRQTSTR